MYVPLLCNMQTDVQVKFLRNPATSLAGVGV